MVPQERVLVAATTALFPKAARISAPIIHLDDLVAGAVAFADAYHVFFVLKCSASTSISWSLASPSCAGRVEVVP